MNTDCLSTLSNDQSRFLHALSSHQCEYVVIGGYAVRLYVPERSTGDIDVLVARDAENRRRIGAALKEIGAKKGPEVFKALSELKTHLQWNGVFDILTGLPEYGDFAMIRSRAVEDESAVVRV